MDTDCWICDEEIEVDEIAMAVDREQGFEFCHVRCWEETHPTKWYVKVGLFLTGYARRTCGFYGHEMAPVGLVVYGGRQCFQEECRRCGYLLAYTERQS